MSIDDKLLDSQSGYGEDKSAETAGSLREARNEGGSDSETTEGGDINAVKRQAKRERTKRLRKKNLTEDRKSISFPYSQRLKLNILNLVTSWGTSFFYIVYHWFQSKLGNKRKYVKLGSEWMDVPGMTEKQRDEIGSNFAPWENCCFVSLAFGCLIALFLMLIPLVMMGYFLFDPIGFTKNFYQITWSIFRFIFVDVVSSLF